MLDRRVVLELTTPWYTKYGNKPLTARSFNIHGLLIGAAERQRRLARAGWLKAFIPDNRTLRQFADTLVTDAQVYDVSGERWSNRQQIKHPLKGVLGTVTVAHEQPGGLAPVADLLWRTEWLHGGGKASFGLGGLKIHPIQDDMEGTASAISPKRLEGE
jgi:hypothetical protein